MYFVFQVLIALIILDLIGWFLLFSLACVIAVFRSPEPQSQPQPIKYVGYNLDGTPEE